MAEGAASAQLREDFAAPPDVRKAVCVLALDGGGLSKTGITKDLEAMKEAGIGGAQIFNLGSEIGNGPWPEQTYRGKAYWDAMRHTLPRQNDWAWRSGLLGTPGYSTTGGPWIDLERGMKRVVWSITEVEGGKELSVTLPAIEGGALGTILRCLPFPARTSLSVGDVVDVSGKMDAAGKLNWNAPAGKWRIYRFGYAPTGKAPHPIPEDLVGHTL